MLRRFTHADLEGLFSLHNDPDVMRFLNGGRPTSRRMIEREYRERFAKNGYWAATEGSRAVIRKGFTELGVRRVFAETMRSTSPPGG